MNEKTRAEFHEYQRGSQVLSVSKPTLSKFGTIPWEGPHTIVKLDDNGTDHLTKRYVMETVNIRKIKPYHQSS